MLLRFPFVLACLCVCVLLCCERHAGVVEFYCLFCVRVCVCVWGRVKLRHQLQEKAGKKERKTTSLRCRVQADGMLNFIVLPAISLFTTRFQLAVSLLMLSRTMGNVTQCHFFKSASCLKKLFQCK